MSPVRFLLFVSSGLVVLIGGAWLISAVHEHTDKPESDEEIALALEEVLAGRTSLEDVRISLTYAHPSGDRAALRRLRASRFASGAQVNEEAPYWEKSITISGEGEGIWEGRVQFDLSHDEILGLLREFQRQRFNSSLSSATEARGTLGMVDEGDSPHEHGSREARVMIYRWIVGLRIGEVTHLAYQDSEAPVNPELARIVHAIRALCEPKVEHGRTAESLEDGLAKLAKKELTSRTFYFQQGYSVPEAHPPAGEMRHDEKRFFSIRANSAWAGRLARDENLYARCRLTDDQLAEVIGILRNHQVWTVLPLTYHAYPYELQARVLNQDNDPPVPIKLDLPDGQWEALQRVPEVTRESYLQRQTEQQSNERFERIAKELEPIWRHVLNTGEQRFPKFTPLEDLLE